MLLLSLSRTTDRLFLPTPNDTLVFLRIALGLLGGGDILGNGIYYHWYCDDFAGFTFRYFGFEWVQPLPEPFFSLFFIVGFLLGLAVAVGWRFRVTAPLFALAFTYLFLLEKAHYLNHAYLFCWLAWLMALSPAWRKFSLDSWRRPADWSATAPAWSVWVFPLLMAIVYFFGGIAKMNYDWLIEAMPMQLWLQARGDMPILGPLWRQEITAYVMSWGGMLLDFSVPFLLLHRRLRWVALAFIGLFHATNHLIFNIGIFPYLSMVMTSLFFEPDWPLRFVRWLKDSRKVPIWARTLVQKWWNSWDARLGTKPQNQAVPANYWQFKPQLMRPILLCLLVLIGIHLVLPLRHWCFDSDVAWSEEGHRYSWRMMLRSKQGSGNYRIVDLNTGEEEIVRLNDSLNAAQYRKMLTHPDMILQYAHYLRDLRQAAGKEVAVYGRFRNRLNGRSYHPYIDPEVDLATTEWYWLGTKEWVLTEE
jgi:hypothetical protein